MKQHISPSQLQELTEEQQERLREWWKPSWGADLFTCVNESVAPYGEIQNLTYFFDEYEDKLVDGSMVFLKKECLPLLSIGQMIELLEANYNEISTGYNDSGCYWTVYVGPRGTGVMIQNFGKEYRHDWLADALWQAVKEAL